MISQKIALTSAPTMHEMDTESEDININFDSATNLKLPFKGQSSPISINQSRSNNSLKEGGSPTNSSFNKLYSINNFDSVKYAIDVST